MGNSAEPAEIENYVHPRLGAIKRVQGSQASQFISFEMIIENQKIFEDWLKEVRVLQQEQQAQEILFLPLEHTFKQTAFCGTGGIASLRYEDYAYSLLPEIHNRREIKRPFNEQELLYLFYNLVKVSAALEAKHRVIGDIKPENILVNDDGYVKIICQYSWPGQPSKWEKPGERLFLSPEECQQKQKKRQPSSIPLQDSNSQAFSIALTILQAGSLRDCAELYQQGVQSRFNELKARDYLNTFQTRYSEQFTQMIKEMLHLNPKKRWKAKQIYNMLKLYQYQILNLEEIAIRLDSSLFVPKVEREQKISIKKMGESHQSNTEHFPSSKNSQIEHNSKAALGSPHSLHYHSPSNNSRQRLSSNNIKTQQSGFQGLEAAQRRYPAAHQKYQLGHPHHQLANEFSNFGRQMAPNPQFTKQNHFGEFMGSSLPLNLSDLQASSSPQYLTQNSMTIPRPIQENNYFLTSPQSKFIRRE